MKLKLLKTHMLHMTPLLITLMPHIRPVPLIASVSRAAEGREQSELYRYSVYSSISTVYLSVYL